MLVVSYHFPPAPGVASSRVGKLVKYLARAGWECTVVAAPSAEHDLDLAEDVSAVRQVRVAGGRRPFLQRLDWAVRALRPARREAKLADVALVSGGPFAIFAVAPFLGVPYVLDLRDPWSWEPRFDRFRETIGRRAGLAIERWTETLALRRAAAVITVTPEIAVAYERMHPSLRGKIHVIRHGFDPDDFGRPSAAADGPVLLHAGTLLPGERSPARLLEAAREVRARGTALRVELVGGFPPEFEPLVAEGRREGWIEVTGRLPRRAATAAMQRAAVLWLEPGDLDFLITGKVYEYLASGTPVVAVAPRDGAVARLLAATGGAVVVGADANAAADAIEDVLAGKVVPAGADATAVLAVPAITAELGSILERAAR